MNSMIEEFIVEKNYPINGIVQCFLCRQETAIKEGTIIFGDRWFHENCWKKYEDTENG